MRADVTQKKNNKKPKRPPHAHTGKKGKERKHADTIHTRFVGCIVCM